MRILVIQDNGLNESLALTEAAGVLKRDGHVLELLIEREERDPFGAAERWRPELTIVPSDLGGHHWTHRTVGELKARRLGPVVIGGTYPTFFTESAFADRNLDYLIVGEAENPLAELARQLESGEDTTAIPGVWARKDGAERRNDPGAPVLDLNELPLPDRALYYKYPFIRDFDLKRFSTGRGCPNTCTSCFNPRLAEMVAPFGSYVRRKSVDRSVREIEVIRDAYPLRSVHFSDDLFVTDEKWLREFADEYPRRIGTGFTCNTTVESITDAVAAQLKRAGCRMVAVGIESGVEELRKLALGKSSELSNDEIARRMRILRDHGIPFVTFNMISLPGETIDQAFKTVRFNQRIKALYTRVNMVSILPQSELARIAIRDGHIDEEDGMDVMRFPDFASTRGVNLLDTPDRAAFQQLVNMFYLAVRYPRLEPLIRRLIKLPPWSVFGLLRLVALYYEQRFFNMSWLSGLRYFRHAGHPYARSKNFATLI